jgi:hypothetical protein
MISLIIKISRGKLICLRIGFRAGFRIGILLPVVLLRKWSSMVESLGLIPEIHNIKCNHFAILTSDQ